MPAQEKSQQTSSKCLAANRFQVKVIFTCEDKEKPVVHLPVQVLSGECQPICIVLGCDLMFYS